CRAVAGQRPPATIRPGVPGTLEGFWKLLLRMIACPGPQARHTQSASIRLNPPQSAQSATRPSLAVFAMLLNTIGILEIWVRIFRTYRCRDLRPPRYLPPCLAR